MSQRPPVCLGNHKHARIETSITRRWFNCSLSKQLIHPLLNNGVMSGNCLDIKLLEVTEQGRKGLKLKMVTQNHIKHKPVRCNASPLIKKFEKHTNLKNYRWRWWGGCGLQHIRSANPHGPLPRSISWTGRDTTTSRLLATCMSLSPTPQMRPPGQRGTIRLWQRQASFAEWNETQSLAWLCHLS